MSDRPALRVWAVTVAAAVNTMIIASLLSGERRPPLLLGALAAQFVFCVGALRGRPGSTMALVLWELTTAVALIVIDRWWAWTGAVAVAGSAVALVVAADDIESPRLPGR